MLSDKSKTLYGVLLVLTLAAVAWFASLAHRSEARVRIIDPQRSLGPLLASEVARNAGRVEAKYALENLSSEPQVVRFEGVSCGCAGLRLGEKELQVGDRVTLAGGGKDCLKLSMRVPLAKSETVISASFTIPAEPGKEESLSVQCRVRVLPDILFRPSVFSCEFRSAQPRVAEKTLKVERVFRADNAVSSPLKVTRIPPQMKVLRIERTAPASRIEADLWREFWQISVAFTATEDLQSTAAPTALSISFDSANSPSEQTAECPVILRRAFGIEAPKMVHFGAVPMGQTRTKRLLIRAADEREFELLHIGTDSTALEVSTSTSGCKKYHWLDASYHAACPKALCTQILIETSHPDCPKLTIAAASNPPSVCGDGGQ